MQLDKTLTKGLAIVETLASAQTGLGVTEISSTLGLTKSNSYRLLQTLCGLGYVTQNSDRSYRATLKVWALGHAVMSHLDLQQIAEPALQGLRDDTSERVNIAVLAGHELLYVGKITGSKPQRQRPYTFVGGHSPLHCTAAGKALLAYQDESFIDLICASLQRYTKNTIVDPEQLRVELRKIRQTGVAISRNEHRQDTSAIAAPVRDPSGRAIASIGLAGPSDRITAAQLRKFRPMVLKAAQAVEAALTEDANRYQLEA